MAGTREPPRAKQGYQIEDNFRLPDSQRKEYQDRFDSRLLRDVGIVQEATRQACNQLQECVRALRKARLSGIPRRLLRDHKSFQSHCRSMVAALSPAVWRKSMGKMHKGDSKSEMYAALQELAIQTPHFLQDWHELPWCSRT